MGDASERDARVRAMFRPRGIAVVGASRDPRNLGRQILDHLREAPFAGALVAVNPAAREIAGVPCFGSVADAPGDLDLAIVAVPARAVAGVVRDCHARGIRSLVVISAGFRETGEEGAALERALAATLDELGMRAIGPNCMGVMNTAPDVRMNATFSSARVPHGKVAFVSQSGALGLALLAEAEELGVGLSYFASLGNKTNVSTNDLLIEWADDPDVELVLLYLENFGNPRRFLELARAITATKPIIAVKSGRTAAAARAAGSHTGALAEPDRAAEALFEQANIVRARTVQELFDYARAFAHAPLPRGPRVAIVTNSGGPGIMATDAIKEHGLELAELSPATQAALRAALAHGASVQNPVDVIAGAGANAFRTALALVNADDGVDAVIAIYTPPIATDEPKVVDAIVGGRAPSKPLLACVLGRDMGSATFRTLTAARVPVFAYPEAAVRALAALALYAQRRARPAGAIPSFAVDKARARQIVERALARRDEWLPAEDAQALLEAYGVPVARSMRVSSAQEAAQAASSLGGAVALKAIAPGLVHKSDAGGVRLGVRAEEAAAAYAQMERTVASHGYAMAGAIVQEMLPPGREVVLGMDADRKFGPLMMVGLGGVFVEILQDVAFRLAPLTDEEARRMVRSIRAFPILAGARGQPPADVAAIEDALLRLSMLASDVPEIRGFEANPFIVGDLGQGGRAADVRVRLWPGGEAPRAPALPVDLA